MENKEFATLYSKVQIAEDAYLLIPQEVIEGYSMGETFYSEEILSSPNTDNLKEETPLVDHVITMDELIARYDYEDIEESFLVEYYTAEEKENIIIVKVVDGKIVKKTMKIADLKKENLVQTLQMSQDGPVILLNETMLNMILNCGTILDMRSELLRIKYQLGKFKSQHEVYGTTRIILKDGKIQQMEDNGTIPIVGNQTSPSIVIPKKEILTPSDFSKKGLLAYLKERVFGHDEELDIIATTIARNLNPNATREDVETILVAGPTGTGKTVTFETISKYFGVPYRQVNTPELVPEGIVGKTLGDTVYSILEETGGDLAKAQRSIIQFDEFDKIGSSGLDVKQGVIDELYKFMEGGVISIKRGPSYQNSKIQTFDTGMTTRIYSGVFEGAYRVKKEMGFGAKIQSETPEFNLEALYNNSSFSKEMFDRIHYKLLYQELSVEDKKRALLGKYGILQRKREMLKRLYGVDLQTGDDFIEAFIEGLKAKGQSMRDVNNIISEMIMSAERIISEEEGRYKTLILTPDTVEDKKKFTLQ